MNTKTLWLLVATFAAVAMAGEPQPPTDLDVLTKALTDPLRTACGEMPAFTLTVEGRRAVGPGIELGGKLSFVRADAERFSLSARLGPLSAELVRDADETRLVLPPRQVVFVGRGPLPKGSALRLDTVIASLAALEPRMEIYFAMVRAGQPEALAFVLQQFGQLQRVPDRKPATFIVGREGAGGNVTFQTTPDGNSIGRVSIRDGEQATAIDIAIAEEAALPQGIPDGLKVVEVDRAELEQVLGRAAVLALDIVRYEQDPGRPDDATRESAAGRLTIDKGRRVARLTGSPREIGRQHGALLAAEARRVCESILYLGGLYQSIQWKAWFPAVLRAGLKHTAPQIPAEYREEMAGLAEGAGLPLELVQLANISPGLFRGAGFVVLPKAAETKKLYHARVLDATVPLALQRDAVLFAIRKPGATPFGHVGYAGLVGAVTGMNLSKVCLSHTGEQVGRWDAIPAPFLMRMALERAAKLDDAVALLRSARRAGTGFYLLSDGQADAAAAVLATPASFDVAAPGHTLPGLPPPVEHCLLVTTDSSAAPLAARIKSYSGSVTSYRSRKLMEPPLAGDANLQCVLLMPKGHDLDIAHARGSSPAYKRPYTRYDLKDFFPKPKKPAPPKPTGAGTKP